MVEKNIIIFAENEQQLNLYEPYKKAFEIEGASVHLLTLPNIIRSLGFHNPDFIIQIIHLVIREKNNKKWRTFLIKIISYPLVYIFLLYARQRLLHEVKKNGESLVIVFKGLSLSKGIVKLLRKHSSAVININGDAPHNMHSSNKRLLKALPVYDHCVFWTRDVVPDIVESTRVVVPFAVDTPISHVVKRTEKYEYELVFVGVWDTYREAILTKLAHFDIAVWGDHWQKIDANSPLKKYNRIKGDRIDITEMTKVYQSSKLALNLLRPQNLSNHNMKTFEIPGLGGVQIVQSTPDHMNFFSENKEIILIRDMANICQSVETALLRTDLEDIRIAGFQRTRKQHTYSHRVKQLLQLGL